LGAQLINPRALHRRKIYRYRFPCLGIANAAIDAIFFVCRMAFDVALGSPLLHSLGLECKVNVRAAAGVGNGFYCPEVRFSARAGEKSPESLEILIPFITIGRAAVQIGAVVIHLPDFDEHISQRFSVTVEYSTGEMSYFTDGGR